MIEQGRQHKIGVSSNCARLCRYVCLLLSFSPGCVYFLCPIVRNLSMGMDKFPVDAPLGKHSPIPIPNYATSRSADSLAAPSRVDISETITSSANSDAEDAYDYANGSVQVSWAVKVLAAVKDDYYIFEDWLEHHIKLLGSRNIYVFDDASEVVQTIEALRRAAAAGVTVVWSDKKRASVPVHRDAHSQVHVDEIPTMSASPPSVHMAIRRKRCFDVIGRRIRDIMPDAYIVPLDVDEFLGYVGPKPGDERGDAIQFDQRGVLDAFSECKKI